MSGLSGITGKSVERKGGPRYMVNWRARLFMADKVIHPATITSVFKTGFCLRFFQAVGIGKEMNVEFVVKFREENHRIRIKAKVDYCLLCGDGADIDIITTQISSEHSHMLANILQELSEAKEFNLRH